MTSPTGRVEVSAVVSWHALMRALVRVLPSLHPADVTPGDAEQLLHAAGTVLDLVKRGAADAEPGP